MTRRDIKVYVAGPISGVDVLHTLANIDHGETWTAKVFQLGFSPFPVFSDHTFVQRVRPIPAIRDVYQYSLAWLAVADAVFLIPGWEKSTGALAEKREAEALSLPIFIDLVDMCAWADLMIKPGNDIEQQLARSDD
jgi:hypothetical protein